MKLIGLIEGIHIASLFPLPDQIPLDHSSLFQKLRELESSLSIGLELISEARELNFLQYPHASFEIPKVHLDLFDYFKSKGNKIHFLESESDFQEVAKLTESLVSLKKDRDKSQSESERKELTQRMDRLAIEIEYKSTLGKEVSILKNISNYNPDLILLGDGHASRFYRLGLLQAHGVSVDEYWQEYAAKDITQEDLILAASASSEEIPMEKYIASDIQLELREITSPNMVKEYPATRHTERLYSIVKTGRVTDGKPDFVGTWLTTYPHRGFFEMYITLKDGHHVEGTIEDCIGSATFTGEINDNRIKFFKAYSDTSDLAMKGPIHYQGVLQNGKYVGHYTGDGISRDFIMEPLKTDSTPAGTGQ